MKHPSTAVMPNSGRCFAANNTAQEILLKHLSYEPQDSLERYPWKGKNQRTLIEDPCDTNLQTMASPRSVDAFEQSWVQFEKSKGDPFHEVLPQAFVPAKVSSKVIRQLQRKNTPRKNQLIPNETPRTAVSESVLYSKDMKTAMRPMIESAPPRTPQRPTDQRASIPTPTAPRKLAKAEAHFDINVKTTDSTQMTLLATNVPSPDRNPSPVTYKRLRVSSLPLQPNVSQDDEPPPQDLIPLTKTSRLANSKYDEESSMDDSSTEDVIADIDSSDESSCAYSHSPVVLNPMFERQSFIINQCEYEGVDCCRVLFKEPDNDEKSCLDESPHQKRVTFKGQDPHTVHKRMSSTASSQESSQNTKWKLQIDDYDTTRFAEIMRQLKGNTQVRELHLCRAPCPADRRRSIHELLFLFVALETLPSLERLRFQYFQAHELELIPLEDLLDSNPALSTLEIGPTRFEV